jgi:hypothetical protein
MAQSALTVTAPNPTPPTNFGFTGVTGPNPPNFTKASYANPFNLTAINSPVLYTDGRPQSPYGVNQTPPPYYDDGTAGATATFAANVAALASGTGATSGGTENTYPGTGTPPFGPGMVGAVPASTSVAHEGAGTETLFTQSYNPAVLVPITLTAVGCGPALTAGVMPVPNQSHASSLSPATNPALTSITPGSTVSGVGTTTLTCTGTNFTRLSVIYVNGVAQPTTFASSTSLTSAAVTKKTSAGPWPVVVITGGVVTTAAQTWTFT